MSLKIDTSYVRRVLLADGWHDVLPTKTTRSGGWVSSFDLDAYEYVDEDERVLLAGGSSKLIPATGFSFNEATDTNNGEVTTYGPLTAVLAVQERNVLK